MISANQMVGLMQWLEEEDLNQCDLPECHNAIPQQYQGEDPVSCCGQDFCSMKCLGEHVRLYPYKDPFNGE